VEVEDVDPVVGDGGLDQRGIEGTVRGSGPEPAEREVEVVHVMDGQMPDAPGLATRLEAHPAKLVVRAGVHVAVDESGLAIFALWPLGVPVMTSVTTLIVPGRRMRGPMGAMSPFSDFPWMSCPGQTPMPAMSCRKACSTTSLTRRRRCSVMRYATPPASTVVVVGPAMSVEPLTAAGVRPQLSTAKSMVSGFVT
jgi:hypothetical protein